MITLAAAILVKEVALFALIPWIWSAIARRDRRGVVQAGAAVVPYALWCVWVRWRLGAFPFLAHTYSRTGALSLPLVGLRQALDARTPNIGVVTGAVIITVVLGAVASWVMRGTRVGALAFVYTILTLCLGKNALAYLLENARVMAVAQVFALLCLTAAAAVGGIGVDVSTLRRRNTGFYKRTHTCSLRAAAPPERRGARARAESAASRDNNKAGSRVSEQEPGAVAENGEPDETAPTSAVRHGRRRER